MKGKLLVCGAAGALLLVGGAVLLGPSSWRWGMLRSLIHKKFPEVRQTTTAELAARLAANNAPKPVLLDVRTPAEFEISHLEGARRIDPEAQSAALDSSVKKDAPIVTYCSVGYRSSAFAQRLVAAGFTNVQNLEGSIFQWSNEGRPLVSHGKPADKVHPFSNSWGKLLDVQHRADVAPVE